MEKQNMNTNKEALFDTDNTTHFGFSTVKKVEKVAAVFHSVASKYDIMNDLMSGV